MASGDWIALAALVITVLSGGIYWLTYIALAIGRVDQKLTSFTDDVAEIREDVDKHDGRLDKLERRAVPA